MYILQSKSTGTSNLLFYQDHQAGPRQHLLGVIVLEVSHYNIIYIVVSVQNSC